jgi:hypothetical protein
LNDFELLTLASNDEESPLVKVVIDSINIERGCFPIACIQCPLIVLTVGITTRPVASANWIVGGSRTAAMVRPLYVIDQQDGQTIGPLEEPKVGVSDGAVE